MEAIATRVEAIAIRVQAMASRLEAIALRLEAVLLCKAFFAIMIETIRCMVKAYY